MNFIRTSSSFSIVLLVAGTIGIAASSCKSTRATSRVLSIPTGYDMFVTPPDGRSLFVLGGNGERAIPQGFFGCVPSEGDCLVSDPVDSPIRVQFQGLATGDLGLEASAMSSDPCKWVSDEDKFGIHCASGIQNFTSTTREFPAMLDEVDTIVSRGSDAVLEGVGSTTSVPIKLVSLSLQSMEPVEISYGQGRLFQQFHVVVSGPREEARAGEMLITRARESSGTYFSKLPISLKIRFENSDPEGPSARAPIELDLNFVGPEVKWEFFNRERPDPDRFPV